MVEYGLILALISVVAVGTLGGVGDKVADTFTGVFDDGGIYTVEEIDQLVSEGYVPVATADELNNIRTSHKQTFGKGTIWEEKYTSGLDGSYIQVSNIDLSDYSSGEGWSPIGSYNNPFNGVFDGGGYDIRKLTINDPSGYYLGLFSCVSNSSLSNINLVGFDILGGYRLGSLVSYSTQSEISSIRASGLITSTSLDETYDRSIVGGLIGSTNFTNITDVHTDAIVSGPTMGYSMGGLLGWGASGVRIERSSSKGQVVGGRSVGGLIGQFESNSSFVENSFSEASVDGSFGVGGLVGRLVGPSGNTNIVNSYSVGGVSKGSGVGGLVGMSPSESSTISSYWNKGTSTQQISSGGTGKATDEMKQQSTYEGWDFENIWQVEEGQYPTLRSIE